jgi:hypothetical protein
VKAFKNDFSNFFPYLFLDYVTQIYAMPTFSLQNGATAVAIGWGQTSDGE